MTAVLSIHFPMLLNHSVRNERARRKVVENGGRRERNGEEGEREESRMSEEGGRGRGGREGEDGGKERGWREGERMEGGERREGTSPFHL